MSIGENIRRLREREGLSQTAFAGRLGVTKETVGRWESGRTFPRRTHLDKMIADFAVCADDIMSEERGLGTAPSAPTADNWPGPETRNDDTGAAEGAGDAILPVYKTDRSGNGTTLRHTGYACAPSDVAARHVASIFVRMDSIPSAVSYSSTSGPGPTTGAPSWLWWTTPLSSCAVTRRATTPSCFPHGPTMHPRPTSS